MIQRSLRAAAIIVATMFLVMPFMHGSFYSSRFSQSATPSPGVIVPLFSYPSNTWWLVVDAKKANPRVPMIAVVNPSDGPGNSIDPNFAWGVSFLQSAGIIVVGYVPTNYGITNQSLIESEISAYRNWYKVDGVFFDQMASSPGYEGYYTTLNNFSKSLGIGITIGNPGAVVASSYVGIFDLLVIYENAGLPQESWASGWAGGYTDQNLAIVSYDVSTFDSSYVTNASHYFSYIYVTNENFSNPYVGLPSYFDTLVQTVAESDPVSLTIQAVAQTGSPIGGLWAVVQSDSGTVLASGYVPLDFRAVPGSNYVVTMSNYGNYLFDQWSNGNTSRSISVTPTQDSTITASYQIEQPKTNATTIPANETSASTIVTSETSTSISSSSSSSSLENTNNCVPTSKCKIYISSNSSDTTTIQASAPNSTRTSVSAHSSNTSNISDATIQGIYYLLAISIVATSFTMEYKRRDRASKQEKEAS
jgi:Spherulation-specific family 4